MQAQQKNKKDLPPPVHRRCSIKQPFCKFESKLRKVQQTYILAFEVISEDLITILDVQPKQGN